MWDVMHDVEMNGKQDEENLMGQVVASHIRPHSDLYRSVLAWLKRHRGAEPPTVKPGRQAKQGEMEWTGESMVL